MSDRAKDALMEAVLSPYRRRDREGRPIPPPEWWDLPPDSLEDVYQNQLAARTLEKGADPRNRSGTVRAVRARLRGI
jgi:hypothetical protein